MVNQRLVDYITQQKARGYSLSQIKNELLRHGWTESQIQEAISLFSDYKPIKKLEAKSEKSSNVGLLIPIVVFVIIVVVSVYFIIPALSPTNNLQDTGSLTPQGDSSQESDKCEFNQNLGDFSLDYTEDVTQLFSIFSPKPLLAMEASYDYNLNDSWMDIRIHVFKFESSTKADEFYQNAEYEECELDSTGGLCKFEENYREGEYVGFNYVFIWIEDNKVKGIDIDAISNNQRNKSEIESWISSFIYMIKDCEVEDFTNQ